MDVILVSMPFAEIQRPSIALGLLKASLSRTKIQSEAVYGNLHFAETVGLLAYQAMQSGPTDHLLGEWCFARLLFPENEEMDENYLNLVLDVRCQGFPEELEQRKELMRWVRDQSAYHIDCMAKQIVARRPRIVGCSSVFQQHCASLALLKHIRKLSPDTALIMGGANCEGEMGTETLKSFSWLDCVVSGEADDIFAELCSTLLECGRNVDQSMLPYGALAQTQSRDAFHVVSQNGSSTPRLLVRDMDGLPTPDYHDYFKTLGGSSLSGVVEPELLAESSRGCWWGEKSHCTFCGLNGSGMKHRSKSPDRVLSEIAELTDLYGTHTIQFVDNILDMSYFKTVLPKLAASGEKYDLFYETKANLKREEVRLLSDAGVRWIQPGIESLDDNVLRLIGKGNSTLMNLQLLKWCCEFGIHAAWNMLCGLPGDSDSWYRDMAEWLPYISHLQPPSGLNRVRYDRFSPYQMRPQDFGLTLQPSRAYGYVYPLPPESLMHLAYSFEDVEHHGHVHRAMHEQPGQQRLQEVLQEWNHVWHTSRPALRVHHEGPRVQFIDTRHIAPRQVWTADGLQAEVYRLCDAAQTPAGIMKLISARHNAEVSVEDVGASIQTLCDAKVLLRMNGKLLSLGVAA
jgi:ribosomal peptide maturation radical SAM protein 1